MINRPLEGPIGSTAFSARGELPLRRREGGGGVKGWLEETARRRTTNNGLGSVHSCRDNKYGG